MFIVRAALSLSSSPLHYVGKYRRWELISRKHEADPHLLQHEAVRAEVLEDLLGLGDGAGHGLLG